MKFTAWIGRLVLCFALSLGLAFQVRGQTTDSYVYGGKQTPGVLALQFTNGATPQSISIPADGIFLDAIVNSTSDWGAFVIGGTFYSEMALFNFVTHETRHIATPIGYTISPSFYKFQRLDWSPDGQQLAFISIDEDGIDVFIYSTLNNELTRLTSDEARQTRITWDHTGTRLASVVLSCDADDYCQTSIEIYDTVTQSVSLSSPIAEGYGYWFDSQVCDLEWSPNDLYLSYVKTCSSADIAGIKEVYLLDTSNGTVDPVTDFTVTSLDAPDSPYLYRFGIYSPLWIDSTHLVIGVAYTTPENAAFAAPLDVRYSVDTMTIMYDVTEQTTSTLFASEMAQGWAFDANTHRAAFLTTTDSHYPSNSPIRVGTLDANGFQPDTTLPGGCDITWSPDGTALAFTLLEPLRENCQNRERTLAIYDVNTSNQQTIDLTVDTWARPLGWIQTSTP